jgi:mono/diheme cytochrome c family protein
MDTNEPLNSVGGVAMFYRLFVPVVLSVLMLGSDVPSAEAADAATGEQIASRLCVGCHGTGVAKGVVVQGVYVPSFSEVAQRPYRTRERLAAFIMIPHRPMPGMALQENEVNHLVEYILSLK